MLLLLNDGYPCFIERFNDDVPSATVVWVGCYGTGNHGEGLLCVLTWTNISINEQVAQQDVVQRDCSLSLFHLLFNLV